MRYDALDADEFYRNPVAKKKGRSRHERAFFLRDETTE